MSHRNVKIEDFCEYCGVEEGERMYDDTYVFRKCFKKLKKEKRITERKGKLDEQFE